MHQPHADAELHTLTDLDRLFRGGGAELRNRGKTTRGSIKVETLKLPINNDQSAQFSHLISAH